MNLIIIVIVVAAAAAAAAAAARVSDSTKFPEQSVTSWIRSRTKQKFQWGLFNGKRQTTARKPSSYEVLFCERINCL
jgi:hypothetical protein